MNRYYRRNAQEPGRRRSRAWTLVELMVALVVVSIFLIGIVTAFIQILRASDRSERIMEGYENARAAVETIALFVKAARIEPSEPTQYFVGTNTPTLEGDRIDNDEDSHPDEEQPDGQDDDGDFDAASHDRHADIGGIYERAAFVGQADLGDERVDEDVVFHRDELAFAIFPDPSDPASRNEFTSFAIGTWEGEDHVLLQQVVRTTGTAAVGQNLAPLAHDVLSLDVLYWDPNASTPYWVESWDTLTSSTFPGAGIELPAAVHIAVTVYAGRKPLDQLGPTEPIETVTASTVINIESVIHDPRYTATASWNTVYSGGGGAGLQPAGGGTGFQPVGHGQDARASRRIPLR